MDRRCEVDYERLAEEYKESLTTVLRGFKAGAEFLETWVPDEDDLQSILNILEAAEVDGLGKISVYIGSDTLRNLDLRKLEEFAAKVGAVKIEANGEGINLNVSFTGPRLSSRQWIWEPRIETPSRSRPIAGEIQSHGGGRARGLATVREFSGSVHPVYKEGLRKASLLRSHEGELSLESGIEPLRATSGDVLLAVQIEPSNHTVLKARYLGASSDIQKGLLEVLCRIMEGKPILECSDHAVIYLEHELRDHSQFPPVPGVVTPENADPIFSQATHLVRSLMAEYRQRTGFASTVNFYDPPSSGSWRALSQDERIRRVQNALDGHPAGQGLEVVSLEGLKRVVIKFNGESDSGVKQSRLIELENFIKNTIDPVLQVYILPMVDKNKIRRIKGANI